MKTVETLIVGINRDSRRNSFIKNQPHNHVVNDFKMQKMYYSNINFSHIVIIDHKVITYAIR